MEYKEDDFLQLSGIQHFKFCQRQWALIYIENQWADNFLTVEGTLMHEKAHNKDITESRGNVLIMRGVSVFSSTLGVSGQCDVLEYHSDPSGISLPSRSGLWIPYPVEYKHGSPRNDTCNELQLCGQAMCLEEMLCCDISEGALYYGEIHRRVPVVFDDVLRNEVRDSLERMHELQQKRYTPKVRPSKSCDSCSLKDLCLPKLLKCGSVSDYMQKAVQ